MYTRNKKIVREINIQQKRKLITYILITMHTFINVIITIINKLLKPLTIIRATCKLLRE